MKLIRYAYPQSQASNAINRLFDIGAPAIGRIGSIMDDFLAAEAEFNQPALDLYEDEQHYYARFELPGLAKDKIDLELENAVLTLQSQQDCQQESKCFDLGSGWRRSRPGFCGDERWNSYNYDAQVGSA